MRTHQMVAVVMALVFLSVVGAFAQDTTEPPPIVSTVDGTTITADAFVTRVELEAWLTIREIQGFAAVFYNQNPNSDELVQAVQTVYGTQIASLNEPADFAGTVLNSMEVDLVLRDLAAEQEIEVDESAIQALILEHITLAQGVIAAGPDATSSPEAAATVTPAGPEAELIAFFEAAEAETGATETQVRALFEGRALREIYYRAVTNTEDGDERTQADNTQFQQWAFAQYQSADVNRADDWVTYAPETDYSEQVTDAIAEVLAAGLVP